MTKDDIRSARVCFNCNGRGTDILYPHVESVVYADAGAWLDSPILDWVVVPCAYCTEDDGTRISHMSLS